MGKIIYIKEVRDLFRKSHIVSLSSIKKLISKHGGDVNYAHLLVSNLAKKGEINQITKGFYSAHTDPVLAVFCFKPAYLGLQDALSIHGLWEQETVPVIITTNRVRQGIRDVFGSNVIVKSIPAEYFFGTDYIEHGGFCVPVSDIEKTLIDMAYFKQSIDKKLTKEFRKRINIEKLKEYLKKYPSDMKEKIQCVVEV